MITLTDLERLRKYDGAALSVYLNIDPSDPDNRNRAYLKRLRQALKALPNGASSVAKQMEQHLTLERIKGKSFVGFAGEGLWWTTTLQVPVTETIAWGRPQLERLLAVLDEFERYGVVLADGQRARLFTVYLGEITEHEDVFLPLDTSDWRRKQQSRRTPSGNKAGGSNRDAFEQRVAVYTQRFLRSVAERAARLMAEHGFDRLILAGPDPRPSELKALLSQAVAEQVVGIVPLPVEASPAQVLSHTSELRERSERAAEQRLLQQVLRPDRGVVGRDETLVALQQGRLQQVLAVEKLDQAGGQCPQCGYVTAAPATCPSCRTPTAPVDLRATLGELAHRHGARFEVVRGEAGTALRGRGGLGGLLRW